MNNDDKMAQKDKIRSRLDEIACEHCKEHQPVKSNRYVICSTSGVKMELMFQKDRGSTVNRWIREDFVEQITVKCLPWKGEETICDGMIWIVSHRVVAFANPLARSELADRSPILQA